MLFDLTNDYQLTRFKEYVGRLYRERAVVEVTKKRPVRSLSQNAYLHLLLGYFATQYGCSADEAKLDFYKRLCNRDLYEVTVTNRQGRPVRTLRSSSALSTEEMSLSIERFRNWSSSEAGIYLPSAHEHQMLLFAQQEVERCREYV